MNIRINSKETCSKASTLQELAEELHLPERGVAMALGTRMVQRDAWSSTALTEGDSVAIIKAVCGG
ncbi:MAG: sulfur carrier protein ThiS [Bacteroidales bacterium]|nr:sulfur carrier protein ThiS [Bacteroidales bacterium]MCM1146644.1 sulfur carrier protein ThiS [Bacteroidales bacterium]MCM1206036.1 sulfur carrier protein ThiS [Bacillota bacterium]MCM1511064.1 sulfur carrier protein ThiS [Clostridium sp.]